MKTINDFIFFESGQEFVDLCLAPYGVVVYPENGTLIRTIGNGDATNAYWSGNDIAIQTNKGKTELRKDNGTLIRTI